MLFPFSDRWTPADQVSQSESHSLSSWSLVCGTSPVTICQYTGFEWPIQSPSLWLAGQMKKLPVLLSPLLPLPVLCNASWYSSDCSWRHHWCPHETAVDNSQWAVQGLVVLITSLIQVSGKQHTSLESVSGWQMCASIPLRRKSAATITWLQMASHL